MNIQIREYKDSDIQEMNRIWNRVVDDGVAFPQEDDLTEETGDSLQDRPILRWQRIQTQERCSDFISCIQIMSDAAVISAMPAMR